MNQNPWPAPPPSSAPPPTGGPGSFGHWYPPVQPPPIPSGPPPWSPQFIAAVSFFCTFLPAAVLHTLNWQRLGQKKSVPLHLAAWTVGFAAFIAAALNTPDNPAISQMFMGANLAIAAYLYKSQSPLFDQHIAHGGTKAAIGGPLAASIAFVVLFGGGTFGYFIYDSFEDDARFEEARLAYEKGDYAAAEPAFRDRKDEYDDPAALYNLTLVYTDTHRFDEARAELKELRKKHPDFDDDDLGPLIDAAQNLDAVELLEEGKLEESATAFRKLKSQSPRFAAGIYNLALVYLEQKKPELVRREIAALRKVDPDYADISVLEDNLAALESGETEGSGDTE